MALPPKAPSGETTAASGFWGITLSGMTLAEQRVVPSPGPLPVRTHKPAGRGAYAIRALPDLCFGIVSGRLEFAL